MRFHIFKLQCNLSSLNEIFKELGITSANPKLVYIQEQKWIVAVISMVPIYAIESVRFYYSKTHS